MRKRGREIHRQHPRIQPSSVCPAQLGVACRWSYSRSIPLVRICNVYSVHSLPTAVPHSKSVSTVAPLSRSIITRAVAVSRSIIWCVTSNKHIGPFCRPALSGRVGRRVSRVGRVRGVPSRPAHLCRHAAAHQSQKVTRSRRRRRCRRTVTYIYGAAQPGVVTMAVAVVAVTVGGRSANCRWGWGNSRAAEADCPPLCTPPRCPAAVAAADCVAAFVGAVC